jgi:glycine/D-amino acid oxidase-like deaminating enzyme
MQWDFGVIGSGIAGAAIAYELAKRGARVIQIEDETRNATAWSYGGIAYWAGNTPLSRQLCQESIAWHRQASMELNESTEFRDRQLLLWFERRWDIQTELQRRYGNFAIAPEWLGIDEAVAREPLLNRGAIGGALAFPQGQVCPRALLGAYRQALVSLGGSVRQGKVRSIRGGEMVQIETDEGAIGVGQAIVASGAWSRELLARSGQPLPIYWTHAELVEIEPTSQKLGSIVMPAMLERMGLEAKVKRDGSWDQAGDVSQALPILDAGAVQFLDGRIAIGQISRLIPQTSPSGDPHTAEAQIRASVGRVLPRIANQPGRFQHCLVAFSGDGWPLVGEVAPGIQVFSGFSSPFVYVPPFAQRLADRLTGQVEADAAMILADPRRFDRGDPEP